MNKNNPPAVSIRVGAIAGLLGSIIGVFLIGFLRSFIQQSFVTLCFSKILRYGDPDILCIFAVGYPLPTLAVFLVPFAGLLMGYLGGYIGLKRKSSRLWLWGGVPGLLVNLFVSFWAQ